MPPTNDEINALVAASMDAVEELLIAAQYSRRPAVRQRLERLQAALAPFVPSAG